MRYLIRTNTLYILSGFYLYENKNEEEGKKMKNGRHLDENGNAGTLKKKTDVIKKIEKIKKMQDKV